MSELTQHLREWIRDGRVVVDRPAGSCHPRFPSLVYPLDYGYLEGTGSADGQELDVWLGRGDRRVLTGLLLQVDPGKRELEAKLLLGCDGEDRAAVEAFLRAQRTPWVWMGE